MSNDKLREAAERVVSEEYDTDYNSVDALVDAINNLRAALADSADDGGVLGARTVERSVEPGTHGEASIDREVRPLSADAPPKSNAALMREAARDLDWMASRAAGHAKRLHISVSLCEAAARIEAALADSADAPPEVTEEMTNLDLARTALNALGELAHRDNGTLEQARCDVLNFYLDVQALLVKRDVLAVAQKEE